MKTHAWLIGASLMLLLTLAAPLRAQDIPPVLQSWNAWALHEVPDHACPLPASTASASGPRPCVWPGRLALAADAQAGRFSLTVQLDAPGWVVLPGDDHAWPQQVLVDDKPQPVLRHDDSPALRLDAGTHAVRGQWSWSTRPTTLAVPESIALVSLDLDGQTVARIERNASRLTLGEAAVAHRAADALALRVYRQLQDGLPPTLQTRLQLDVAGSAREQLLGPALPAGFVATALSGDLPVRLEPDGRLRVQLRPGQWTMTLEARGTAPLSRVALQPPAAPWPAQETWSYVDDTALRGTRVEGDSIDAERAGVPADWQALPAYRMDAGHGLTIAPGNRGDTGAQPDQLTLTRSLWLDFDGDGFSAIDHLAGTLQHPRRLDAVAPWQLRRASQGDTPLLVSRGDKGAAGVELRQQALDLTAGLHLSAAAGRFPSAGWSVPLESVDATVHLPPGYRLLGASGADRSPDSWLAQWSLLDLFVVALIALLAGRALGWPWAALAGVFFALAQHESGAPRWTLAVALALILLLRVLPAGRLRTAGQGGALAAFALAALWTLPFAATELNLAMHPQLESGGRVAYVAGPNQATAARERASSSLDAAAYSDARSKATPALPAPPAPPSVDEMAAPPPMPPAPFNAVDVTVTGANSAPTDGASVAQAGGGAPTWDQGNTYRLSWSGPVTVDQSTRVVIVPAWLVRLLRVLMVGLLLALLAQLLPPLITPLRGRWQSWPRAGASAALIALALLGAPSARAQNASSNAMPSPALLDQLRQRLTEPPKCAPDCVALSQAKLSASGDALTVTLDAQAGADAAMALPEGDQALSLEAVTIDGHAAALLRNDNQLLLRLERGVHRVVMQFHAQGDTARLSFPVSPGRIDFTGPDWTASGIDANRLLGDSLALSRQRRSGADTRLPPAQSFPPYVRLTRRLMFGVDWRVENVAERLAPAQAGFSTTLPLLSGEHPLGADTPVQNGAIAVTFSATSNAVRWTSRLDHAAALSLTAPPLTNRAEVWEVQAAPIWHVDASGVPTSASDAGLRFQPLPGEQLKLILTQPAAIAGGSLAFDRVAVQSEAGQRASAATLSLSARSTRGGEHVIRLPKGATLLGASRDGEPLGLSARSGELRLPLLPGTHAYELRLRLAQGVALITRSPALSLNAPAANINVSLALPRDRWVLWVWGPPVGPAVLLWSQLIVLLLAAWALARWAPTPLRRRHWLLLGLGFSAFAWSAYALVVLWLLALGLRARMPVDRLRSVTFNALQAALALLTLMALLTLIGAVPNGLLGLPDMHVAGNDSSAFALSWFADRSASALPTAGVLSLPLWVYKLAMLAWALWLAHALIGWLRWGFDAWSRGGYWRKREPETIAVPPQLPPADAAPHV